MSCHTCVYAYQHWSPVLVKYQFSHGALKWLTVADHFTVFDHLFAATHTHTHLLSLTHTHTLTLTHTLTHKAHAHTYAYEHWRNDFVCVTLFMVIYSQPLMGAYAIIFGTMHTLRVA